MLVTAHMPVQTSKIFYSFWSPLGPPTLKKVPPPMPTIFHIYAETYLQQFTNTWIFVNLQYLIMILRCETDWTFCFTDTKTFFTWWSHANIVIIGRFFVIKRGHPDKYFSLFTGFLLACIVLWLDVIRFQSKTRRTRFQPCVREG